KGFEIETDDRPSISGSEGGALSIVPWFEDGARQRASFWRQYEQIIMPDNHVSRDAFRNDMASVRCAPAQMRFECMSDIFLLLVGVLVRVEMDGDSAKGIRLAFPAP